MRMRPRRLLLLINSLYRAGSERNVATICKTIDRRRYNPEVWTLFPGGEYEPELRKLGIPIRSLDRGNAYSPRFSLRAAQSIARSGADVVHAYSQAMMVYAALGRSMFRGAPPLVFTEATTTSDRPGMLLLHRMMLSQCSAWVANSEASRSYLATHGIPSEKIEIVPNGHELLPFRNHIDREEIRREFGLGPEHRLAICVGRLIDTKRVVDLIEAAKLLVPRYGALRFLIVGDGVERVPLEQAVRHYSLEGKVLFAGVRGNIPALLRAADLFVFPSEVEGLSNSVIEAALAGLPIVGCDIGGVRDVVLNGSQGLLVPPRRPDRIADAIAQILDNDQRARALGVAAREGAERQFSIEGSLNRFYDLYDRLAALNSVTT